MAALDGHAGGGNVGDLDGVVFAGQDGVGKVNADLLAVNIESGNKLDIVDVVLAELNVHQTRDRGLGIGVAVVLHTLDERGGAVTHTNDGNTNRI